ncbi:rapid alkalinization factor-like [Tripterygium wilfordii]|uniref:rapid alkalinization factor-like n=1 Tax=Tripterygium wilfordii TaxID=458696 RepID=UPI0018F84BF2|nr:rapid alkalinization factor-like [Tripterygium wilfordii]
MAKFFTSATLLSICAIMILMTTPSFVDATADHNIGWIPTTTTKPICKGSIAECLAGEEEFELDSEINRRILATSNYISYGALQRNTIPCSRRGASYYNCQSGAQANPYNRGCSAITRCRG